MSLHIHRITGCAPTPLAYYLKALGILRLVSEQADNQARGWWEDEHFCLLTKLEQDELERFFLEHYKPTPIFNPWGARSGYYSHSSESTSRLALKTIEQSTTDRLEGFRTTISTIRAALAANGSSKPDTEELKTALISSIHQTLRGAASDWLATVLADLGDSFYGPAIMGTGGNEGSGGYPAAFLAAVVECIIGNKWENSLAPSLFGTSCGVIEAWDGSFSYPHPRTPGKFLRTGQKTSH